MKTESEIKERLESPDNLCNFFDSLRKVLSTLEEANGQEESSDLVEVEPKTQETLVPDSTSDEGSPEGTTCATSESLVTEDSLSDKSPSGDPVSSLVVLQPMHNGGRRPGDKNYSREEQVLAATLAHQDTVRNVAEAFDMSTSQVANLKRGRTTDKNGVNPELMDRVLTVKEKISSRVLDKILQTEDSILVEEIVSSPLKLKLEALKVLASVAEKMTDKEAPDPRKFVVFVPIEREADHYGPAVNAPIKVGG